MTFVSAYRLQRFICLGSQPSADAAYQCQAQTDRCPCAGFRHRCNQREVHAPSAHPVAVRPWRDGDAGDVRCGIAEGVLPSGDRAGHSAQDGVFEVRDELDVCWIIDACKGDVDIVGSCA